MINQMWNDNEQRECKECKNVKPILDFPTSGVKRNREYRRRLCKPCYNKYKRHYRSKQRAWVK